MSVLKGEGTTVILYGSTTERLADQAMSRFEVGTRQLEGMEWDGRVYYPLVIGEATSGVLAVETTGEGATREDTDWRRVLGSAVALVGLAGRNAQLSDPQ